MPIKYYINTNQKNKSFLKLIIIGGIVMNKETGIKVLKCDVNVGGHNNTIYPVLIIDKDEIVLVDAGYPGQLDVIESEMQKHGLSMKQITKLIITHQDIDHIGCAKEISNMGAKIYAHEIETPYIQGDKTPVKLAKMEQNENSLTADRMGFYKMMKNIFPSLYVHVDEQVKDEQELPFCGGIVVYHTPGHTPGHIALLHKESNTLIAGDAANISNGKLVGSNPIQSDNTEQAATSLKKIKSLCAKFIICYHSGLMTL